MPKPTTKLTKSKLKSWSARSKLPVVKKLTGKQPKQWYEEQNEEPKVEYKSKKPVKKPTIKASEPIKHIHEHFFRSESQGRVLSQEEAVAMKNPSGIIRGIPTSVSRQNQESLHEVLARQRPTLSQSSTSHTDIYEKNIPEGKTAVLRPSTYKKKDSKTSFTLSNIDINRLDASLGLVRYPRLSPSMEISGSAESQDERKEEILEHSLH